MKTILMVGFSNFGPYKANSSAQAIEGMTAQMPRGFKVRSVIFPADIPAHNRGQEVLDLARKIRAYAIVCLGMASDRHNVGIECEATNRVFHSSYCPAELNNTPVSPSMRPGAAMYAHKQLKRWQMDRFIEACRGAGLPRPQWSMDAGGFCCNHLMFQILLSQRDQPARYGHLNWTFLHVPCTHEAVPEPGPEFLSGQKIIMPIEDLLWHLRLLFEHGLPRRRPKPMRRTRLRPKLELVT